MFTKTHMLTVSLTRLLVALCFVATVATVATRTAAAAVNAGQSGTIGSWVPDAFNPPPLGCVGGQGGPASEEVLTTGSQVSPASAYSRYTQTITMYPVLEASKDGLNYVVPSGGVGATQSQTTVGTAPWVTFGTEGWMVSSLVKAGYQDFLAFEVFDWYAGPTHLGELIVGFSPSDVQAYLGAGAILFKGTFAGCAI